MAVLNRVEIKPDRVKINVRKSCLIDLLSTESIDLIIQGDRPEQDASDILTLNVTPRLQRVGCELKMLVEHSDNETKAHPGLLRIIARAHDLEERVIQNNDLTLHASASQEHVTPGYLSPTAPSFTGARHHYGDCQWQESASAHRQKADATGARIASRLARTAEAASIPINGLTRSDDAVYLAGVCPTGLGVILFSWRRPLKC